MGTVQFRSAVVEAAQRLNQLHNLENGQDSATSTTPSSNSRPSSVQFQAIVPQAKPLSPGEVLGCTAPSGLATLNWKEAMMTPREKREFAKNKNKNEHQRDDESSPTIQVTSQQDDDQEEAALASPTTSKPERIMIFLADGRFHLEAAMISNPSLRALRYDPYSKTLTEEKYEIIKMKRLRREAVAKVRRLLGIKSITNKFTSSRSEEVENGSNVAKSGEDIANSLLEQCEIHSSTVSPSSSISNYHLPKTIGIILGTLGRQGNPGISARIRSLLHKRGVRTMIVLLSEIFPKKLEMLSGNGGVSAWVQIACPRLRLVSCTLFNGCSRCTKSETNLDINYPFIIFILVLIGDITSRYQS
jgi:diphthamide synthase subunit DPH2